MIDRHLPGIGSRFGRHAAASKEKGSEKLLGSTTERVIAAAATPVLVVKKRAETPYKRAVLATNGTDAALNIKISGGTKIILKLPSYELPLST